MLLPKGVAHYHAGYGDMLLPKGVTHYHAGHGAMYEAPAGVDWSTCNIPRSRGQKERAASQLLLL